MPQAIITTRSVLPTPDGRAVEVIATLDAGVALPGMFLHIPLNGMVDFTIPIRDVTPQSDGSIRLLLDCDNDPQAARFIMAFDFEDETLQVLETGKP